MSLTSYRTAPPRVSDVPRLFAVSFRLVFSPSRGPADPDCRACSERATHIGPVIALGSGPRSREGISRSGPRGGARKRALLRAPVIMKSGLAGSIGDGRTSSQATRPVRQRALSGDANGPGLGRPGGDLLSHALRRSTIGAEGFHGRVRDGIGCFTPRHSHQAVQSRSAIALSLHRFTASSCGSFAVSQIFSRLLLIAIEGLLLNTVLPDERRRPGPFLRSRARRGRDQANRAISTG